MQHITQVNVTKTIKDYFSDEFKLFSLHPFRLRWHRFVQNGTREHREMEGRSWCLQQRQLAGWHCSGSDRRCFASSSPGSACACSSPGRARAHSPSAPLPRDSRCRQPPWPGHSPELESLMQEIGKVLWWGRRKIGRRLKVYFLILEAIVCTKNGMAKPTRNVLKGC